MSNIDPSKPTYGKAYTSEVRQNFVYAKQEIEALEYALSVSPVLSFNARTGDVILNSPDVTTALGYNPISISARGAVNGVASLDAAGVIPITQLPSALTGTPSYRGTWNAATNVPVMASGALVGGVLQAAGNYYLVSVGGTTAPIDGVTTWAAGDWISSNGTIWQRIQNSTSPYLPLTGGTITGALTVSGAVNFGSTVTTTGNTTTGSLTSTGSIIGQTTVTAGSTSGNNGIVFSGGTSPLMQVTGTVANGGLTLRAKGTGATSIGSDTSGNTFQFVPAGTASDTLQIWQPATLGTQFQLRSVQGMAITGGIDFFNVPVSISQTLVYSGNSTKRNNMPFSITQTVSGESTNIGTAYPFNRALITLQNFQSGETINGNMFQLRSGTGAKLRNMIASSHNTGQMAQPVKTTDASVLWQPNTSYSVAGTVLVWNGYIWMLVTPGVSAPSGPGPKGSAALLSTNITDGTCIWNCEGNEWLWQGQVACNILASASYHLGGTPEIPIGVIWGTVIGSGSVGTAASNYRGSVCIEVDDYFRGTTSDCLGISVVKMGTSGTNHDWGVIINGQVGQGYWNPFIVGRGVMPGGTVFAVEDQIQGIMLNAAGGLDFNSLTPDGLGPGGGGYFVRWGGDSISGNIDRSGSLFLGYGGIRPTTTGLTINARRFKFTGFSSIVNSGSGWQNGYRAKDQYGNIVQISADVDGHTTGLLTITVAAYQDTIPTNPVTFYPITTGTTVGPFLQAAVDDTINKPNIVVPFTANVTYAASATPNVTIGATTDRIGFFGAPPVAKPTGVAVTAAAIHAALVSLGAIAP